MFKRQGAPVSFAAPPVRVARAWNRRAPGVALTVAAALALAPTTEAGVPPEASEELTGGPAGRFEAFTLDGQTVTLADLAGRPVVVNFFASWCPPCQTVLGSLREIHPTYKEKGVTFLGVLVDAMETPETVQDARKQLADRPLPYPVVLLNPSLKDAFEYRGWPSTYFITLEGKFSTTLYGLQPATVIREVADRIAATQAPAGTSRAMTGVAAERTSHPWQHNPWGALVPARWRQWHPMLIHFPIALLVLEALCLLVHLFRPREELARLAAWLLLLAVISFIPAIMTGIADSGVDAGLSFGQAFRERYNNAWRTESAVSLHVLYALAAALVAAARLTWLHVSRSRALRGKQRIAFAAVTLVNLWLLFGAGQVGGGISHA